jgi:hypothetical protein
MMRIHVFKVSIMICLAFLNYRAIFEEGVDEYAYGSS